MQQQQQQHTTCLVSCALPSCLSTLEDIQLQCGTKINMPGIWQGHFNGQHHEQLTTNWSSNSTSTSNSSGSTSSSCQTIELTAANGLGPACLINVPREARECAGTGLTEHAFIMGTFPKCSIYKFNFRYLFKIARLSVRGLNLRLAISMCDCMYVFVCMCVCLKLPHLSKHEL